MSTIFARGGVALTATIFLGAIFYGDVNLVKIVVPVAVLLLPVIWLVGLRQNGWPGVRPHLLPMGLLIALAIILLVQFSLGKGPSKADLALYLPVIYALATLGAFSSWGSIGSIWVWRGVASGAAVTGAVMLAMMFFAPPSFFLIPGQVPEAWTAPIPIAVDVPGSIVGRPDPSSAPEIVLTPTDAAFYEIKNLARNALGRSNYIAVFLVFAFTVALFSARPIAAATFAVLAVVTMSRFGFAALVLATTFWALRRLGVGRLTIGISMGVITLLGTVVLFAWGQDAQFPGAASIAARAEMLQTSVPPITSNWLIGLPRSVIMTEFGVPLEWSPHNSVAQMTAYFGLVGLAAYVAYLIIGLRQIYLVGRMSPTWRGCYYGFVVVLVWSAVEIIVLTPAFELLFACLSALAWAENRQRAVPEGKSTLPL